MYLYEQLKDQLGSLHHNIKRYGNKIRREDDENNILFDRIKPKGGVGASCVL